MNKTLNKVWEKLPISTIELNFLDLSPFVFNSPESLIITGQTSERSDAVLDVVLNEPIEQFQKVTITPTALGLVILHTQAI